LSFRGFKNSKFQAPNSKQIQKLKKQIQNGLGAWNLVLVWNLVLGAWDLFGNLRHLQ